MRIEKRDFQERMEEVPSASLLEILACAGIAPSGDEEKLAGKLAEALWWRTHSPAGLLHPKSLGEIADSYAERLGLELVEGGDWEKLLSLSDQLLPADKPVTMDELPPELAERLQDSLWPRLFGTGAAGSAAASGYAARTVLRWTSGQWLRLIRMLPKVGPAVIAVRSGAGWVASLSGPIGIAAGLWTLNQSFGPRWDKALPLLLGAGLAIRSQLPAIRS
jgi:hypothetical protein